MTKTMLFILSIPAFPVLFHAICSINAMGADTAEPIRWARIMIAIGAGSEIISFIAVSMIDYGTWTGIKFMISGAFLINLGYSIMYIANRRRCDCQPYHNRIPE